MFVPQRPTTPPPPRPPTTQIWYPTSPNVPGLLLNKPQQPKYEQTTPLCYPTSLKSKLIFLISEKEERVCLRPDKYTIKVYKLILLLRNQRNV